MLSIYDVFNWEAGKSYSLYDIYEYPSDSNTFYYSNQNHNSGGSFNTDFSDGVAILNGKTKPNFFWVPSYNSNINIKPTIKKAQFSDSYSQVTPDGINNILLPFNLTFDKRSDAEARAILHFLNTRKGTESFIMTPPFPYNIAKLFRCEEWNHSQLFADNHTINAIFIETYM